MKNRASPAWKLRRPHALRLHQLNFHPCAGQIGVLFPRLAQALRCKLTPCWRFFDRPLVDQAAHSRLHIRIAPAASAAAVRLFPPN